MACWAPTRDECSMNEEEGLLFVNVVALVWKVHDGGKGAGGIDLAG